MFQIKEWISCISSNVSFVVPTLASLRLEGAGLSLEDKARVIWDIRRKNLGSGPSAVVPGCHCVFHIGYSGEMLSHDVNWDLSCHH